MFIYYDNVQFGIGNTVFFKLKWTSKLWLNYILQHSQHSSERPNLYQENMLWQKLTPPVCSYPNSHLLCTNPSEYNAFHTYQNVLIHRACKSFVFFSEKWMSTSCNSISRNSKWEGGPPRKLLHLFVHPSKPPVFQWALTLRWAKSAMTLKLWVCMNGFEQNEPCQRALALSPDLCGHWSPVALHRNMLPCMPMAPRGPNAQAGRANRSHPLSLMAILCPPCEWRGQRGYMKRQPWWSVVPQMYNFLKKSAWLYQT